MIYESEKLWFQLKRLWRLSGFVMVFFLYLLYLCQADMLHYIIHKDEYEVVEAEIISFDMTVEKKFRGGNRCSYYAEVKSLNNSGNTYWISRDVDDFVEKKVYIAINKDNPSVICRAEWIRPKDNIWILTCGMGWILILLFLGKILSCFKLKSVFSRIDQEYLSAVEQERLHLTEREVNVCEKDVIVTKIKRDANLSITMETNEIIKSPVMLGHTYLEVGDFINIDDATEKEERVNWSNYFL